MAPIEAPQEVNAAIERLADHVHGRRSAGARRAA
jgi:hypothetical protein